MQSAEASVRPEAQRTGGRRGAGTVLDRGYRHWTGTDLVVTGITGASGAGWAFQCEARVVGSLGRSRSLHYPALRGP